MFPESTSSTRKVLHLSDTELATLVKELGRRVEVRDYPYLEVRADQKDVGDIFILDVLGQTLPITFAVGVEPRGAVRDIQVMVYREPRGDEVREDRFRRQFRGKRLADPIALGRDVDAISGATISSRSATYATRKALALDAILRARPDGER